MVTYHYPPDPLVGAVRPSKFVKYLPSFGWEPIVLTTPSAERTKKRADGTHCVNEWPHPLKKYYEFKEYREKARGRGDEFAAKMNTPYALEMTPSAPGITRLKRAIIDMLSVPDKELGWLIPTIAKGLWLIRKRQITHLITTAPPFTTLLTGLVLKQFTNVRWVADFRDPWSLNHKGTLARNRIIDPIEARAIRSVMRHADLVVSVTPMMTEQFKKEHPETDPQKFVTVTNGFDPSEFNGLTRHTLRSGPIVFSYLGEFYGGRTPKPFLRALASLIGDGTVNSKDVLVDFIGWIETAEGQPVVDMIRDLKLEGIVNVERPIPRPHALQRTLDSDVLLVLTEQQSHALPFKTYDALASGGTILNIGCGGSVADMLSVTGRGIAVDHLNQTAIRNGILEAIQRAHIQRIGMSETPWHDASIQSFNFQRLTGTLDEMMKQLK